MLVVVEGAVILVTHGGSNRSRNSSLSGVSLVKQVEVMRRRWSLWMMLAATEAAAAAARSGPCGLCVTQ